MKGKSHFTKKDYELIAGAIKKSKEMTLGLEKLTGIKGTTIRGIERVAQHIADELRKENPKFKVERFLKDCGVGTD